MLTRKSTADEHHESESEEQFNTLNMWLCLIDPSKMQISGELISVQV
jgi:hypothetical protein